jgi:hypothetical protein
MPHKARNIENPTLSQILEGHRRNPTTGEWETHSPAYGGSYSTAGDSDTRTLNTLMPSNQGAGDFLDLGEGDAEDIIAQYMLGQRFQAIRRADGSIIVLDRSTGEPKTNLDGSAMVLAPAVPTDPTKPDISFHHDPNRGTYFALDNNTLVVTVISEETPEVQRGFQYVMEAEQTIANAGLDPSKYDYIYEDGRVVPVLTEDVPPDTSSFFTATAANGQLLAVSRLTGIATNIGDAPIAARVPTDGDRRPEVCLQPQYW